MVIHVTETDTEDKARLFFVCDCNKKIGFKSQKWYIFTDEDHKVYKIGQNVLIFVIKNCETRFFLS